MFDYAISQLDKKEFLILKSFYHFLILCLCRSSLQMKRSKTSMTNTGHYEQRR
uniref:Uncharacterized protein n=1 Tax=Lotus japonicus TaxID=34305 RepID=I3SKD0_LOTJA|nr:unknown [Lotus japonicus]